MSDTHSERITQRKEQLEKAYRDLDPALQALFSERVSLGLRSAQEIAETTTVIESIQREISRTRVISKWALLAVVGLALLSWLAEFSISSAASVGILVLLSLVELVAVPLHHSRIEGFSRHRNALKAWCHMLDLAPFHSCLKLDQSSTEEEVIEAFNKMHSQVLYSLNKHTPSDSFVP